MAKQHGLGEEASALSDRVTGSIKDTAGELVDDPALERRGEEQNARGRERQQANQVLGGTDRRYVSSFYEDPVAAGRAYEHLRSRNYAGDDIDVVISATLIRSISKTPRPGRRPRKVWASAERSEAQRMGAALAALFAVGTSIAIPGLGLVVAGPIAAALAGAGAGAATGGSLAQSSVRGFRKSMPEPTKMASAGRGDDWRARARQSARRGCENDFRSRRAVTFWACANYGRDTRWLKRPPPYEEAAPVPPPAEFA